MTRGNQRELARQKNMKKQADQKKGREIPDGMNLTAIKTLDADIMRQKQAKALEKKQKEEEERLAAARATKTKP